MAEESTTGAIALGLVAAGVGIFAIEYATSEPGKSWFDQIKSKLASKDEEAHALAPGKAHAEERRALPQPRTSPIQPSGRANHPRVARTPVTHAPVMTAPKMISPEMVKETARQLNAVFGTKLRTDGIITTEIQRAIKRAQEQLGLPPTGYPDWRLLVQLGKIMQDAAQPVVTVADTTKIISKTFGGPSGVPKTGPDEGLRKTQQMLNAYFRRHVLDDNGYLGPYTTGAIKEFQKAEKLPDTGAMDAATHDLLVKRTTEVSQTDSDSWFPHRTGAAAGADWKSETQDLPQFSQDVLAKVMATETNARTLQSLGKVLSAAGYSKAAAAVLAKVGGTSSTAPAMTAASGYYPDPYYGYYPLVHGPYGQW